MLPYKYSQLGDQDKIPYKKSMELCKKKRHMHLGQLKLFFTELIFLTKCAKPAYKIIYVGAAPGYHTTLLADMFPEVQFDLWDPRKFETESRPNVQIFNDFFTDVSARSYDNSTEKLLFMCDLRTLKIGFYKKQSDIEGMDDLVTDDMAMQMRWCQIIKPEYAYLKFRPPYEIPKMKYLGGTIYLQPYTRLSTEARLLTNNYDDKIIYDVDEYNDKLAYHNAFNRCSSKHFNKWRSVMDQYNLYNNWDNALALHITNYYLVKIKSINSKEEVGKLFMEIINFHIDRFEDKYDILFDKKKKLENNVQ